MHLFVNCKLVDSVCTEIFQKINEFYEQNEIKTISKSENSIILEISHRDDHINAITLSTNLQLTKRCIKFSRSLQIWQLPFGDLFIFCNLSSVYIILCITFHCNCSHELLLMLKSENIKQENPCEFIKNDKILENTKNLSSKIYSTFLQ
jgi:hypothetical protein